MPSPERTRSLPFGEKQLRSRRLLEDFRRALRAAVSAYPDTVSRPGPERMALIVDYLCLFKLCTAHQSRSRRPKRWLMRDAPVASLPQLRGRLWLCADNNCCQH